MKLHHFQTYIFFFFVLLQGLQGDILLATYNVRNYLLTDRLVPTEDRSKSIWRKDYPKPEFEKRALRSVIAKENPDILALQEMGSEAFLKELQRDLRVNEKVNYPYSALMQGVDEDRHVAVLSKVPFLEVVQHKDLTYKYFGNTEQLRRGLLEVKFMTNGVKWSLFNVHLKSKWTIRDDDPESAIMREAEATAVRNQLKKLYPTSENYPFLLVGDFNDTPNTKPIARILNSGKTELAWYIYSTDARGRVWTHYWRRGGSYTQVDYIFASVAMLGKLPNGKSTRGRIEDSEETLIASDHRMVLVELPFRTK